MREIYLLNMGDSVDRVKYEYGDREYELSNDLVLNKRYITLEKGMDDITIVRNYLPFFEYKLSDGENIMDILARGFDVLNKENCDAGDTLILSKPKSIRYVVGPLENLEDISCRFGVSKGSIITSNNLKTDKLFVGQILWI